MKYLVDECYQTAEKIGVIQDQLNTHLVCKFLLRGSTFLGNHYLGFLLTIVDR